MALSLNHPPTYPSPEDVWPFDIAAAEAEPVIAEFLKQLEANAVSRNLVMNVNFPNVTDRKDIKGMMNCEGDLCLIEIPRCKGN